MVARLEDVLGGRFALPRDAAMTVRKTGAGKAIPPSRIMPPSASSRTLAEPGCGTQPLAELASRDPAAQCATAGSRLSAAPRPG
jgi:hypothetical protein